jgi:hypothetical protein
LSSRPRCRADEESCDPTARAPREKGSSAAGKRERPNSTPTMHNTPPRRITARPPRDHRTSFDACALANSVRQTFTATPTSAVASNDSHFEATPTRTLTMLFERWFLQCNKHFTAHEDELVTPRKTSDEIIHVARTNVPQACVMALSSAAVNRGDSCAFDNQKNRSGILMLSPGKTRTRASRG